MIAGFFHGRSLAAAALTAALAMLAPAALRADTFLSGFEGDLSSSLGMNWDLLDTDGSTPDNQFWGIEYINSMGVTQGAQALKITHPADAWQLGLRLDGPATIPVIAQSNRLEFDVTASPDATWRAVWVIMQGDGLSWAQANQVDAAPGVTTHASIDLTAPANGINWKASAAASGGGWWQVLIAIMGGDSAQPETYTIIDNVRFTGGAIPGDINGDTTVDRADLLKWEQEFGNPYTGEDFIQWQRHLTPPTVISAVPEPGAAALALAGAALLADVVRRRRARRTMA
jgi:hypothetical protein